MANSLLIFFCGEDDRQKRFGVALELSDGVKFGEDLQSAQGTHVNDDGLEFSGGEIDDLSADRFGEHGAGVCGGVDL